MTAIPNGSLKAEHAPGERPGSGQSWGAVRLLLVSRVLKSETTTRIDPDSFGKSGCENISLALVASSSSSPVEEFRESTSIGASKMLLVLVMV